MSTKIIERPINSFIEARQSRFLRYNGKVLEFGSWAFMVLTVIVMPIKKHFTGQYEVDIAISFLGVAIFLQLLFLRSGQSSQADKFVAIEMARFIERAFNVKVSFEGYNQVLAVSEGKVVAYGEGPASGNILSALQNLQSRLEHRRKQHSLVDSLGLKIEE